MSIAGKSSCSGPAGHDELPFTAALQQILSTISPLTETERVSLRQAHRRVLADAITAPIDVPNHANSAMDGFAIRAEDLPKAGEKLLRVVATLLAGERFHGLIGKDQCLRIMTGAPMPCGADTVIMLEHVEDDGDQIQIDARHVAGENVRAAGEDVAAGSRVFQRGRRLNAADIGVIASLGIREVDVLRRPRVAFFSTGDELRSLGEALQAGEVYDSNRYTLYAMLEDLDVDISDLGVIKDNVGDLRQACRQAAASADVVITSGGVSMGEADFVKPVLRELGCINFWKIAMKPGRPLAFGRMSQALFFGLPGNPVGVMLTFHQVVRAAIVALSGETPRAPITLHAISVGDIRKRSGRTEFPRGILSQTADGEWLVANAGAQGAGVLSTMSRANCYIVLEASRGNVVAGDKVTVQPFCEFF